MEIMIPPPSIDLTIFNSVLEQKISLSSATLLLKATRDRLLSRLMSGKIDVEKLDIQFPASMREDAGASTGSATATDFTAKKTSSVTEPVGEPVEPVEAPAK
jgi:hypothetical protein